MAGFGDGLDRVSTDGSDGCSFFFYNIGHNLASLCGMVRKACVQQFKSSTKKVGIVQVAFPPATRLTAFGQGWVTIFCFIRGTLDLFI